jgi:excisionase family DNA binding protein
MEHLLTVDEIAKYLKVQPSTIYQWTHQGFIPHIKIGNAVRFRQSCIDQWLEEQSRKGRNSPRIDISLKLAKSTGDRRHNTVESITGGLSL